jgi:uracil phosphoribosyltransferase
LLLTELRNRETESPEFRDALHKVSILVLSRAISDRFDYEPCHVKTLMGETVNGIKPGESVGFVAILGAGLGMVQAGWLHLPSAPLALLAIKRDELTLKPVFLYERRFRTCPDHAVILDPMLATGGTASYSIHRVKNEWKVKKITYVSVFAALKGIQVLHAAHPDVPVYTAAMGSGLNSKGYIENACNDAGDRTLGT